MTTKHVPYSFFSPPTATAAWLVIAIAMGGHGLRPSRHDGFGGASHGWNGLGQLNSSHRSATARLGPGPVAHKGFEVGSASWHEGTAPDCVANRAATTKLALFGLDSPRVCSARAGRHGCGEPAAAR